jgi:hypothetical protein
MAVTEGVGVGDRLALQQYGNSVRRIQDDPAWLSKQVLRRLRREHFAHRTPPHEARRIVISGFRHPEELKIFLGLANFHTLQIWAPEDARHERGGRIGVFARDLGLPVDVPVEFDQFRTEIDAVDRGLNPLGGSEEELRRRYGQRNDDVHRAASEAHGAVSISNASGNMGHMIVALDATIRRLDGMYRPTYG